MDVNNFMITGLKKSIFLESDYFLKFAKIPVEHILEAINMLIY